MTFIFTAITFLKANRWAQILGIAIIAILAFSIWLALHDRKVITAHENKVTAQAEKQAEKATQAADKAQEQRDATFNESQAALRNTADPAAYLKQLRANQCKANPAACR